MFPSIHSAIAQSTGDARRNMESVGALWNFPIMTEQKGTWNLINFSFFVYFIFRITFEVAREKNTEFPCYFLGQSRARTKMKISIFNFHFGRKGSWNFPSTEISMIILQGGRKETWNFLFTGTPERNMETKLY